MRSAKKRIEDFLMGLKCPVRLRVNRSCRNSRLATAEDIEREWHKEAKTRYRCRNCGWEGTEEEMHGDFAGETWTNWICPDCEWGWRLDDYVVIPTTPEEVVAEFDARETQLDADTRWQMQDFRQHFYQQVHDLYRNRAIELEKLHALREAELAKLAPENHVEDEES